MNESTWPKVGLEHDQKIFTMTNLIFGTWLKFTTPTNITFTPSNCDAKIITKVLAIRMSGVLTVGNTTMYSSSIFFNLNGLLGPQHI